MKTFAILVLSLCAMAVHAQTIRRVHSLPVADAGANTYATVADAVAASAADDIIYIEPSSTEYAGFTVTKRLHFIGNGNFLEQNPNTPFDKNPSIISTAVSFDIGSSGSTITGLYLRSTLTIAGTTGIEVKRNRFGNGITLGNNTSGILIAENYIDENIRAQDVSNSGVSTVIRNNIIRSGNITYMKNSVIQNNTIYYSVNAAFVANCTDSQITNNIFDRRGMFSIRQVGNDNAGATVTNNLQIAAGGIPATNPDANKNMYTSEAGAVFVVASPWGNNPTKDASLKLVAGSLATNLGTDGKDAGAFGGTIPYTLSGLPNVPVITSAVSTETGTNTIPLSVTISVRSN
jgi:hypothetical protein